MKQTVQCHPDHIGGRDKNQCQGYQNGFWSGWPDGGIVHDALYGKETQSEAQRQAAGIAHEYLGVALGTAKEDEVAKGYQSPHHAGNQDAVGVDVDAIEREVYQKSCQGHERESCSQSVNTIDKIDGVVDEHNDKNGQRDADVVWNLVDAEKPIEVVDV